MLYPASRRRQYVRAVVHRCHGIWRQSRTRAMKFPTALFAAPIILRPCRSCAFSVSRTFGRGMEEPDGLTP
jgi:hypothetical protein